MSELEGTPVELTATPDTESVSDAAPETAAAEETTQTEVEGAETGDPAAPAQPAVEEPVVEDPYDTKPDKISPDGKLHYFRIGKANAMKAALDFQKQLDAVIPGVTAQDVQSHYQRSVNATQMVDDFHSGDPDSFGRWMDFHVDPETTSPQSVAMLTDGLLERLPQQFPQVYERLQSSVMSRMAEQLYNEAARTGDQKKLALAQNIDFTLTGEFKAAEQLSRRDPLAEREAALARREQDWQVQTQQSRQAQIQQFMANTDIQVTDGVNAAIEAALTLDANGNPIAHMAGLKGTPDWNYAVHQINQKVADARKANPIWEREYNLLRARATQRPSAESRQAVVDKMRTLVSRVAMASRKDVIAHLSTKTLSASAQAQTQAQAGALKREPSGGGKAVNPSGDLSSQAMQMAKAGKSADDIRRLIGIG